MGKWKRMILVLVAMAVFAGVLYAATYDYTVQLDEKGHKRLVKMLQVENARRAAKAPALPALSEAEYVQQLFSNLFMRQWRRQRRRLLRQKTEDQLDADAGVN